MFLEFDFYQSWQYVEKHGSVYKEYVIMTNNAIIKIPISITDYQKNKKIKKSITFVATCSYN